MHPNLQQQLSHARRTFGYTNTPAAHLIAQLLELRTGKAERPQVPQHKVVVGATCCHHIAALYKSSGQSAGVRDHLMGVSLELGSQHFFQLRRDSRDLVLVRATLR